MFIMFIMFITCSVGDILSMPITIVHICLYLYSIQSPSGQTHKGLKVQIQGGPPHRCGRTSRSECANPILREGGHFTGPPLRRAKVSPKWICTVRLRPQGGDEG